MASGRAYDRDVGWLGAVWMIITGQVGSGILFLPGAWAQTGWILSPILFCVFGSISAVGCFFSAKVMDLARQVSPRARLDAIEHVAAVAGGKWFKRIVAGIFYFDVWFLSAVLLAAMASTTQAVIRTYTNDDTARDWYRPLVALMTLVLYPLCLPRGLGFVSKGAALGVVLSVLVVCAMFWGFISDYSGDHRVAVGKDGVPEPFQKAPLVATSFDDLGNGWSTLAFAFAAAEMIPSVYLSMKKPELIKRVILVSHVTTVSFFVLLCVIAIWVYGDYAKGQVISDVISSKGAKVMIAVCIASHLSVTIPVWLHPVGVCLEDTLQKLSCFRNWKPVVLRVAVRTAIVLSVMAVAILSPQVVPLSGVSAAFSTTIICVILPMVLYIMLKRKLGKAQKSLLILDCELAKAKYPNINNKSEMFVGDRIISTEEAQPEEPCGCADPQGIELLPDDVEAEGAGPLAARDGQVSVAMWVVTVAMCAIGTLTMCMGAIYAMRSLITSWTAQPF